MQLCLPNNLAQVSSAFLLDLQGASPLIMKSKTQRSPLATDRQSVPPTLPLIIGKVSFDSQDTKFRVTTAFSNTYKRVQQTAFDATMPIVNLRQKTIETDIQDLELELRRQRSLNRDLRRENLDLSLSTTLMSPTRDEGTLAVEAAFQAEDLTSLVSTTQAELRQLLASCANLAEECKGMHVKLKDQEQIVPVKQREVDRVICTVVGS